MTMTYTENELVGHLSHSSDLNIVVEGPDDILIYRWVLDEIGVLAHLCATGGCGILRKVYLRRSEFPNAKVIFISDKDTYVYNDTVPVEYSGIIFTKGYSIENDMYFGRELYNLFMDKADKQLFDKALDNFLLYYVAEIDKMKAGGSFNLKEKARRVLNDKTFTLDQGVFTISPTPTSDNLKLVKNQYDLLLRGHSLFGIIEMVLNRKDRGVRHNEGAIYEICYKNYKSSCIKDLQKTIKSHIDDYDTV